MVMRESLRDLPVICFEKVGIEGKKEGKYKAKVRKARNKKGGKLRKVKRKVSRK